MSRVYFGLVLAFCFLFATNSFANSSEKKVFKQTLLDIQNFCQTDLAKFWPDDRKRNLKRIYKRFNETLSDCENAIQAFKYLIDDKRGIDPNSSFPVIPPDTCPGGEETPEPTPTTTLVPPKFEAPPVYPMPSYAPPAMTPPIAYVPPPMGVPSVTYPYP